MALQRADAIGDQTLSTGTGSAVLTGTAIQGFLPFLGNITDGATVRYRRQNVSTDPALDNTQFEVTTGVWNAGTMTLTRAATPFASSNAGALVNFTLTPQAVVVVVTAADFADKADAGAATGSGLTMATGKLLGRGSASTGAIEEITLGTNLSFTGTTLNAAGGGGGGGGGATLLATLTASNSASLIDTTSLVTAGYTSFEFVFVNIVPASEGFTLTWEISTDGGSTWLSDANYYAAQFSNFSDGSSLLFGATTNVYGDTSLSVSSTPDDGGVCGSMTLVRPDLTGYKLFGIQVQAYQGGFLSQAIAVNQYRGSTSPITAIKFYQPGGNLTSGSIQIWGVP